MIVDGKIDGLVGKKAARNHTAPISIIRVNTSEAVTRGKVKSNECLS